MTLERKKKRKEKKRKEKKRKEREAVKFLQKRNERDSEKEIKS